MNANFIRERLLDLRQLTFPSEFRVHARRGVGGSDLFEALKQIRQLTRNSVSVSRDKSTPTAFDDEKFIVDLSIRLWRIWEKLSNDQNDGPIPGGERAFSMVEQFIGKLESQGIRTEDRKTERYDAGMLAHVVSFEPVEGLETQIIKETIEPAVYKDNELIHRSHIVVGTPVIEDQDSDSANEMSRSEHD